MFDARGIIADLDEALSQFGETVTLTRFTDGPNGTRIPFSVDCQAFVRANAPQELDPISGDAPNTKVIMSPTQIARAQWPGPPQKDDRMLIQGHMANVEIVSPIFIGGQLVRLDLQCRS
jgi:hypothetical protein